MNINPKIDGMLADRPMIERFMVAAICSLLGPKKVDALLADFNGRDIDWQENVAGKPLHYYNGKHVGNLRAEGMSEEAIAAVQAAYEARGLEFADAPPEEAPAAELPELAGGDDGDPDGGGGKTPPGGPAGAEGGPDAAAAAGSQLAGAVVPPEGDDLGAGAPSRDDGANPDGIKVGPYTLGDLRGKSDDDLLAMPNVGKSTLKRVRELEAQYPAPAAK